MCAARNGQAAASSCSSARVRAREADRNLGYPEHVLDVARHYGGVEGKLSGVIKFGRCIRFDKFLSLSYDAQAVIVFVGTGYFLAHGRGRHGTSREFGGRF